MKRIMIAAMAVLTVATTALAFTEEGNKRFRELLNGYKEAVDPVSTTGTGTFHATISEDETEIDYELTFADLEGDVLQAHIHIGHPQTRAGSSCGSVSRPTNPGRRRGPRAAMTNDP